MKTIALAAALAAVLAARGWAEEPAKPPRDWTWLTPGKTRRPDIEKMAGAPVRAWKSVLTIGTIDLNPTPHLPGSSAFGLPIPRQLTDPKTQIAVDVLSYEDDTALKCRQLLVLHEDRLLYALLPPGPGEGTVAALAERYPDGGDAFRTRYGEGCVVGDYPVVAYADARVAYVCSASEGSAAGAVIQRLRWCGPDDFAPAFKAEWKLPRAEKIGSGDATGSGKENAK